MNVADHIYNETLGQLHSGLAGAFQRQRKDVLEHIQATIDSDGTQIAAQHMNDLIAFGQVFTGEHNIFVGDALSMTAELRRNDINPGSYQWRKQVEYAVDRQLLRLCTIDTSGCAKVYDESAMENTPLPVNEHLDEAMQIQQERLSFAVRTGDEETQQSAQRIISRIQEQIDRQDGTTTEEIADIKDDHTEARDQQEQARWNELAGFEDDYSEHFADEATE